MLNFKRTMLVPIEETYKPYCSIFLRYEYKELSETVFFTLVQNSEYENNHKCIKPTSRK